MPGCGRRAPPRRPETQYATGVCALVAAGVGVGVVNPIVLLGAATFDVEVRPFLPKLEFGILELSRRARRPDALVDEFAQTARSELGAIVREQTAGKTTTRRGRKS